MDSASNACWLLKKLTNESSVEDICETGARVAVNAGMVALGLPPSIPSYNELVDKGVDHAVELAIEEFEAKTGVPCFGPCEDALRAGFEAAAEEIKRQPDRTACVDPKEAHKHGREPRCASRKICLSARHPGQRNTFRRLLKSRLPAAKMSNCHGAKNIPTVTHLRGWSSKTIFPGGIVYGKTAQQSIEVKTAGHFR